MAPAISLFKPTLLSVFHLVISEHFNLITQPCNQKCNNVESNAFGRLNKNPLKFCFRYMGMWNNDMKNGPGCTVTINGLYYEGIFSHNKMSGKGLMIFEDDSIYEGQFADTGVFNGAGILNCTNGDKMEGSFYGNHNNGIKFNGTIFKRANAEGPPKAKIGLYAVRSDLKWQSIYSKFLEMLNLPENRQILPNTALIWEQLAICINQAKNNAKLGPTKQLRSLTNSSVTLQKMDPIDFLDGLEMIPEYYNEELSAKYLKGVNEYLEKAFNSPFHPLENLLISLSDCFNSTYVRILKVIFRSGAKFKFFSYFTGWRLPKTTSTRCRRSKFNSEWHLLLCSRIISRSATISRFN